MDMIPPVTWIRPSQPHSFTKIQWQRWERIESSRYGIQRRSRVGRGPTIGLVALPIIARKERIQFLNLHHEQQRNLHVDMDALARQAFARIDES